MDLRKLQRIVVEALDDIKAQDIQVFNTTEQTELFDRVVIATATSNRQTRALASHLRDTVKTAGGTVIAVEGEESGEWVLVDLGDIVVHIMQPAIRSYYRLEELWGQKPVRLKALAQAAPADKGAGKPASARSGSSAAAAQTAPASPVPADAAKPVRRTRRAPAASKPAKTART